MKLAKHTFLVTGGASGLGLGVTTMLIEQQANVVVLDVNESAGKAVESALGEQCVFVATDVTNENAVNKAIDMSLARFGSIAGVINCAGIGPAQRVLRKNGPHDLSFFEKIIQINLIGTFNVIRLVANQIQHNQPNEEGERGVIINTASVAAFDGQIGQAAYAASKGGIVAMTLPIARELARWGIRVMSIAPGIFETPLLAAMPIEAQVSLGQQVPFPPRLGKPSEFALLVRQIIENPMLNGEVIRLDGAIRMAAK